MKKGGEFLNETHSWGIPCPFSPSTYPMGPSLVLSLISAATGLQKAQAGSLLGHSQPVSQKQSFKPQL